MTHHRPQLCVWETTLACNLACRHCGSAAGKPRARELDTAESLRLLETLRELGTEEVTFSGGEPFLRPDWLALMARARQLGLRCLIVSNGLSITRQIADELAHLEIGSVSISVDGGPRVHDDLRPLVGSRTSALSGPVGPDGPSSHEQLGWAIDNLRAADVPVCAITQVSKTNLAELGAIRDFLVARGIEAWQIQLTNAMGRNAPRGGGPPVPTVAPSDLPALHSFIRKVQDEGEIRCLAADCIGYYTADEPLLRSVERPGDNFWRGCQAGMHVVGITSDGGVKGCLSLPDSFLEGNLRERPLSEIWHDEGAFAYNRRFSAADLCGACATCAFGKLCRAGCHSFAATAQDGDISRYDHCLRRVSGDTTETS